LTEKTALGIFFAEPFRSFFAEAFWSVRHFCHLSHSCIKTLRESDRNDLFRSF